MKKLRLREKCAVYKNRPPDYAGGVIGYIISNHAPKSQEVDNLLVTDMPKESLTPGQNPAKIGAGEQEFLGRNSAVVASKIKINFLLNFCL